MYIFSLNHKVRAEITYIFAYLTVQSIRFVNGQLISFHTSLPMWLLIHAGIKATPF